MTKVCYIYLFRAVFSRSVEKNVFAALGHDS